MSEMNKALRRDPPATSPRSDLVAGTATNPPAVRPRSGARPAPPPEQGLSARFVLTALRRWWMVAAPIGLVLAAIGGTAVYLLFEPVYEASAWFKIEEQTPYLAFASNDQGQWQSFFQTESETIHAPFVLDPVVQRPEIARVPEIARQADKVAWLGKQIKTQRMGQSQYFKILFSNPDPKAAADVVNAVTEAYFKLRDQSDTDRNQKVITLLAQEMDKWSKDVLRLRDNLRTMTKDAAGKDPFLGKMAVNRQQMHPLADLDTQLVKVEVDSAVLEARKKALEDEIDSEAKVNEAQAAAKPAAEPAAELTSPKEIAFRDSLADQIIEGSPEVQKLQATIALKQAKLKEIEEAARDGKNAADYKRKAAEIAKDEKSLEKAREEMKPKARHEAELSIAARRSDLEMARAARRTEELAKMQADLRDSRVLQKVLQERYEAQRKNVTESSTDEVDLDRKRDDLARAEKVYETLAQRTLQLQTERGAPARITAMGKKVEPPTAPVELFPYKPMALATFLPFFLTFGLAVFWERLVGRVGDSQTFEQESTVAVVGEITHLPTRTSVGHNAVKGRIGYELRLFEESIDSLRTSLSLSEDLAGMRVLAVTSAVNHEGKTSVAAQLAVSFARATGEPLLLIDGDMRSPDVHRVFQIPLEPGLAKVLGGQCSLEDAIVTSWSNNVHLLPAGRLSSSPHKLLGNGTWKSLMAAIPARYRYVVIDTPPVLAASEALVLARAADATLVCMMRDVSRTDQVRKTIERLAAAGSRPVGTVLNGVSTRQYASRYGDYAYADK